MSFYDEYRPEDIGQIRGMRDDAIHLIVNHEFKNALGCLYDLKNYLKNRNINPERFDLLLDEIIFHVQKESEPFTLDKWAAFVKESVTN